MNIYEISLSEFALRCERMGMNPLDIIYEYLVQTKQETEALDIIPKLAQRKADRIQSQLDYARSWIPLKVDVYKANKNVTRQQAEIIDRLTDYYCLGMDIPEQYLAKVREVVPNMATPKIVFVPMTEWLRDKYNIMFKDMDINKENKE